LGFAGAAKIDSDPSRCRSSDYCTRTAPKFGTAPTFVPFPA